MERTSKSYDLQFLKGMNLLKYKKYEDAIKAFGTINASEYEAHAINIFMEDCMKKVVNKADKFK